MAGYHSSAMSSRFRGAVIRGERDWLSLARKRVDNENVMITDMFDMSLPPMGDRSKRPVFQARNVFITGCNVNFTWYWVSNHKVVFPDLELLFLNGNPKDIIGVLKDAPFHTHVAGRHYDLCNRWSHNLSRYGNIIGIADGWFEGVESEWEEEPLVMSKI